MTCFIQPIFTWYSNNKKQKRKDKVIDSLDQLQTSIDYFRLKQDKCLGEMERTKNTLKELKKSDIPLQGLRTKLGILECGIEDYQHYVQMELLYVRAYFALRKMYDANVSMDVLIQYTGNYAKIKTDSSNTQMDDINEKIFDMETIVEELGQTLVDANTEILEKKNLARESIKNGDVDIDELFDRIVLGKEIKEKPNGVNIEELVALSVPKRKPIEKRIEESEIKKTKQTIATET